MLRLSTPRCRDGLGKIPQFDKKAIDAAIESQNGSVLIASTEDLTLCSDDQSKYYTFTMGLLTIIRKSRQKEREMRILFLYAIRSSPSLFFPLNDRAEDWIMLVRRLS